LRYIQEKRKIAFEMTRKTDQLGAPSVSRLRISLRQLEVFAATAQEGSTRAAARRVARSQSAASAALAALELELGASLFDRQGRRLLLNENGRALLPLAQSLLQQAASMQALFASEHGASLRLAASLTIGEYLLPRLVSLWADAHPQSKVKLHIGNTREVIDAVAAHESDVGFIEGPQTHPDLVVCPWLSDQLVIVAAPRHPLVGRRAGPKQLSAVTWVLREQGSGTRHATDALLTRHLEQVNVGYELGSTEAVKHMVAEGLGLACLSRHAVAQALLDGRLVEIKTAFALPERRLAVVMHRARPLGTATAAFLQHCSVSLPSGREGL
jgi:DNA-binding transcriptional LysR family regulator